MFGVTRQPSIAGSSAAGIDKSYRLWHNLLMSINLEELTNNLVAFVKQREEQSRSWNRGGSGESGKGKKSLPERETPPVPVPDELRSYDTLSDELTRKVGPIDMGLHGGSRSLTRSPEEVVLGRERRRRRRR